jgi:hypothetical protein
VGRYAQQINEAGRAMRRFASCHKNALLLMLLCIHGASVAQDKHSAMSEAAREGQRMQNKLYPQIQLPFSYNYNQKIGSNNGSQQSEFAFQPIIPIKLGTDLQLLLNPMLTFNRNINYPQAINQLQPIQLATFFAPRFAGD